MGGGLRKRKARTSRATAGIKSSTFHVFLLDNIYIYIYIHIVCLILSGAFFSFTEQKWKRVVCPGIAATGARAWGGSRAARIIYIYITMGISILYIYIYVCVCIYIYIYIDIQIDRWMDGWMDGWIDLRRTPGPSCEAASSRGSSCPHSTLFVYYLFQLYLCMLLLCVLLLTNLYIVELQLFLQLQLQFTRELLPTFDLGVNYYQY